MINLLWNRAKYQNILVILSPKNEYGCLKMTIHIIEIALFHSFLVKFAFRQLRHVRLLYQPTINFDDKVDTQ